MVSNEVDVIDVVATNAAVAFRRRFSSVDPVAGTTLISLPDSAIRTSR